LLKVENLSKVYQLKDQQVEALKGVSFTTKEGEILGIVGKSGSGKSTLMKILRGVETFDSGKIEIDGLEIKPDSGSDMTNKQRQVTAIHLQRDFGLWTESALNNVAKRVYSRKTGYEMIPTKYDLEYEEVMSEAMEYLTLVGLQKKAKQLATILSGGEKQRVSLARALACKPDVVLLDEPLSSLDPQFRGDLRATLKELHRHSGLTFLMVTHDFVDALTLADRAAVIRGGGLEQVGAVNDVFRKPATAFVAGFVGMKNIFPVEGREECALGKGEHFAVSGATTSGNVALRPEDVFVSLRENPSSEKISLPGTLLAVWHEGFSCFFDVSCGNSRFTAALDRQFLAQGRLDPGQPVWLGFAPQSLHFMPGC